MAATAAPGLLDPPSPPSPPPLDEPDTLPEKWVERFSRTHQRKYFYNEHTGARQWTRPMVSNMVSNSPAQPHDECMTSDKSSSAAPVNHAGIVPPVPVLGMEGGGGGGGDASS
eukprot:CAMPEP_0185786396 /NCGR_PEP_ID=MMETSP1174-20130828/135157_1 /TAXON_ID=35687 /ORGANISM="Dictyocha speculum, Strain CCMP1381" /LENGTH=112 /DNA_ID=CAMNT_0028479007 /DNA_START=19 /DNA_END=353 /DNA_ORIENTATION=-